MKALGAVPRAAAFLLGVGLAFQAGCQFDPYAGEYLTSAPPRNELIGEWVFCEASPEVPDNFGRTASLLLSSDGHCEFRNPCRVHGPWLWGNEELGRGTWCIAQRQEGYCCVEVDLCTPDGKPLGISDRALLRRVNGVLTLHYTFGDPDDGRFVLFRNTAGDKNAGRKAEMKR